MKMRAAVLWECGKPMSVEEVDLDPPGRGEVLVQVKAAGVCHSDLHPARGDWPTRTPVVLGHEGAGIVREVGPEVHGVEPGDHVVFCWAPACGVCPSCAAGHRVLCDRLDRTTYRNRLPSGATRLRARGVEVGHFLSTACFAEFAVLSRDGIVVVSRDVPFDALATLGCAVVTGVGAVTTAAQVPAGSTVAVIGAGGVGLNVIQAARLVGAERIIAIDRSCAPLALAEQFGATDISAPMSEQISVPISEEKSELRSDQKSEKKAELGTESTSETEAGLKAEAGAGQKAEAEAEAKGEDVAQKVRTVTAGRGADFAFDTVGSPETVTLALQLTRKGGTVVVTGLSRIDATAGLRMFPFVMQEKKLIGSVYGSGRPTEDILRLIDWYRHGRLKLRELVTRTYTLNQIDEALSALARSAGARGVILQ